LAAATFVAVDPAKRIGEARDAQRWQDITAIADAYMTYVVDNNGSYVTSTTNGVTYWVSAAAYNAGGVETAPTCTASTGISAAVDLHGLVAAGYIGDIPDDPGGADNDGTDYYFYKDGNGKVIVGACEKYSGTTNYPTVIR